MRSISRLHLLALIFFIVTFTHCRSRVVTPFDSGYSIHLAMSLLTEGDLDLDEYRELIPKDDYRVIEVDGHLVSRYPAGPSVLAVPVVGLVKMFSKDVLRVPFTNVVQALPAGVERLCGSLFVAGTALLIFLIARRRLEAWPSLLVVFIFAFCTSSWSLVSRALWQHGPSMLFLSATLWTLLRAREEPRFARHAGLFLALAVTMRPTNVLAAGLLTIYVALEHRDQLLRFLGWAAAIAVLFLAHNLSTTGSLLPWYYLQSQGFRLGPELFESAAGTLISPGRGLFIYSSVFLFSLLGMWLLARQKRWTRLDSFLAAWLGLHWLLISSWFNWWGGATFGPRLFADVIPVLIYFLIPVIEQLTLPSRVRWPLAAALVLTVVASFGIHRAGALDYGPWEWNSDRTHIDSDPSRIWAWDDPPFLRRHRKNLITPAPPPPPFVSAPAPTPKERKAERRRKREEQRQAPGR